MDEFVKLMRLFIDHKISVDEFVDKYMALWKELRDLQNSAIEEQGLKEELIKVNSSISDPGMTSKEYREKRENIVSQVKDLPFPIGSKQDQIISRGFSDCYSYVPEDDLREDYELDEKQLYELVKKNLEELDEIAISKNKTF
jgi:hypothetical protein